LFCTVYTPLSTASRRELHSVAPAAWLPGLPVAVAVGELGGTLTGLCVRTALGRPPLPVVTLTITATPAITTTASTATMTITRLLRGTVLLAGKLPECYVFGQSTRLNPLCRKATKSQKLGKNNQISTY
jgi:hypothetical protein